MRNIIFVTVAAAALLAGCSVRTSTSSTTDSASASAATDTTATTTTATTTAAADAAPTAGGLPTPPAGQWRASITINGQARPAATSCITAEQVGFNRRPDGCTEFGSHMDGAAVVTRAVCTQQGVTITTDSRAEGDFNTRYSSVSTVVAGGTTNHINATMEYLGPCPNGGAGSGVAAGSPGAAEAAGQGGTTTEDAPSTSASGQ